MSSSNHPTTTGASASARNNEESPPVDGPIYMATVSAPTNIACIKYWGKADADWNTPTNDSVSVTLDQHDLRAVTSVAASTRFPQDRLWLNGTEDVAAHTRRRFRACVDGVTALAADPAKWEHTHVHVASYNTFPTAAGLASSAAGYAALTAALAELMDAVETYPGQLSTIARQGSGSACRSLYGGFVAWQQGSVDGGSATTSTTTPWADSRAVQVADEHHWPDLRALILVVSDAQKDTSSTAGMSTSVATSTLLPHRIATIVPARMVAMERAFLARDFATFGKVTMQDSNQFHAVCADTYPPIFYMNDISRAIVRLVHAYNTWAGAIRVAYTYDAGPNAVLYTLAPYAVEVGALMAYYFPSSSLPLATFVCSGHEPTYGATISAVTLPPALLAACDKTGRTHRPHDDVKRMYYTKSGPGPQVLSNEQEGTLDPTTGFPTTS